MGRYYKSLRDMREEDIPRFKKAMNEPQANMAHSGLSALGIFFLIITVGGLALYFLR